MGLGLGMVRVRVRVRVRLRLRLRLRLRPRVSVHEAALLEERVRGVGEAVAHAHHGADDARARPHVRDAPQRLQVDLGGRDRVLGAWLGVGVGYGLVVGGIGYLAPG